LEHKFNAADVFAIHVDPQQAFPLNLEFVPNKNLAAKLNNSGIYFLTYKDELIYIGYAIKEDAISRMKKQLEGMTLRGKNLAFKKPSKQTIRKSNILNSFFLDAILAQKKSVETSPKRILFAEQHWKDFAFLDSTILRNFVFHWFPTDTNVEEKCAQLKKEFRPRCNKEGVLFNDFFREINELNKN
jgi:hypothetical protein